MGWDGMALTKSMASLAASREQSPGCADGVLVAIWELCSQLLQCMKCRVPDVAKLFSRFGRRVGPAAGRCQQHLQLLCTWKAQTSPEPGGRRLDAGQCGEPPAWNMPAAAGLQRLSSAVDLALGFHIQQQSLRHDCSRRDLTVNLMMVSMSTPSMARICQSFAPPTKIACSSEQYCYLLCRP